MTDLDSNTQNAEEGLPDRPLECSECKKNIAVCYTEVIGENINRTSMCADCPELKRRLHGVPAHSGEHSHDEVTTSLACGNCGTTLDSLRVGMPVGCPVCYEVFNDVLLSELMASKKVAQRTTLTKKSLPIHIGRAPGESMTMNPTLRLLALNEALNETLKIEDYEQAAWLRDQIKALTENPEASDEGK